jgi:EAL domain-containing protein (putative c-di-GMP-specific phosphodiesterase class I)
MGQTHVTASLGIELVSDEILSIDEVLARTQFALQHSKRNGKNRVSTQNQTATQGGSESADIVLALQREGSFRVSRQPILRLSDGSVIAWEMIPCGPAGVFALPRDFFRLALERNILTQVDLACSRACVLRGRALPASCCHVNVFPSTLLETPSERLVELFTQQDGDLRFCVEISEQHFIGEPALLRGQVRALQEAGIRVAIDDVGFGRSSLETLILLEPDLVKLDAKFVHGVARDAGKERSLRRMAGVVASLNSEIIADGIESREDRDLLLELGVPYGQGALWGPPA